MKQLAKQAIALGYAFPHEDAETLHDNLVMLNTTGEAQGFVVDILEQKLSKMGLAFEDIDLKAMSVNEKLKLINEVVADSQKQMDASAFSFIVETDANLRFQKMQKFFSLLSDFSRNAENLSGERASRIIDDGRN